MAIKIIQEENLSWINIDKVDDEALEYLKTNYNFHHLDLDDVQSESQTPKIDTYKNYLFVVLHFPHWDSASKKVIAHEVDIFVGEKYLITIQHTKSKEMKNFFYRCMKNNKVKKEWMNGTPGHLLYRLMNDLFKNSRPILNNIGKHISAVEDEIFQGEQDTKVIKELALHRRNVLSFRRTIDPQRYLVANLSHTRTLFLDEHMSLYFDDVADYLNKLWAISDTYKDTIDGLHVTVESLINQKTNKVIGALTVISVALLPLTLFSGIYGMNVNSLPHANNPLFVWGSFGILAAIIIFVIAIMRRGKWI